MRKAATRIMEQDLPVLLWPKDSETPVTGTISQVEADFLVVGGQLWLFSELDSVQIDLVEAGLE